MTDGGTYEVTLDELPREAGEQTLSLSVAPAEGALGDVEASMPSMGHGSDGTVSDEGEGHYLVDVALTMPGVWVLTGLVDSESFSLEFDVP